MNILNRRARLIQLYDETGNAFFPVANVNGIVGGVQGLDIGTTLLQLDLTSCLSVGLTGDLKIKAFNNIIYTFCMDITKVDNTAFDINTTIILARDIPDMVNKVEFNSIGSDNSRVRIWLENHYLKAMVTPMTEQSYTGFISTLTHIIASGSVVR